MKYALFTAGGSDGGIAGILAVGNTAIDPVTARFAIAVFGIISVVSMLVAVVYLFLLWRRRR